MTETPPSLASAAERHPRVFEQAFNSGRPDDVDLVYEPGGVLVAPTGRLVSGSLRRAVNASLMEGRASIRVRPRHVYAHDDIALLIVDWEVHARASGDRDTLRGTATDVARRGTDGLWRYVIDNPWGVEEPPEQSARPAE